MRKILIEGREYALRFDMSVMDIIEEEYGNVNKVFGGEAGQSIKTMVKVACWMMNAANRKMHKDERYTPDDFSDMSMAQFKELGIAVRMAFNDSMSMTADIEVKHHRDGYLEEMEKNVKTVEA